MIVDAASALRRSVDDLRAAVDAVLITVHEDQPEGRPGHKFLQDLADDVTDLAGAVAEIGEQAGLADRAAAGGVLAELAEALVRTHRGAMDVSRRLRVGLLGGDRPAELRRLTRSWGPSWQAWSDVARHGLTGAGTALDDVDEQVLRTWSCFIARAFASVPPSAPYTERQAL